MIPFVGPSCDLTPASPELIVLFLIPWLEGDAWLELPDLVVEGFLPGNSLVLPFPVFGTCELPVLFFVPGVKGFILPFPPLSADFVRGTVPLLTASAYLSPRVL